MKDLRNIIGSHLNDGHILVDVTENFDSGFVRIIVDSESSLGLTTQRLLHVDLSNQKILMIDIQMGVELK